MSESNLKNTITIELSDDELLPTKEFIEFLLAFRTIYSISREYFGSVDEHTVASNPGHYVQDLQSICSKRSFEEMRHSFGEVDLGDYELQIVELRKNSATIIVLLGVLSAVTIAAIVSGGEVKAKTPPLSLEFKLPPIADGIGKIKDLFKKN